MILASRRESEFDLSRSSDLVHGEVSEGDLDDIAERSRLLQRLHNLDSPHSSPKQHFSFRHFQNINQHSIER